MLPSWPSDATARALRKGRATVWVPAPLVLLAAVFRMLPRPLWRRLPR